MPKSTSTHFNAVEAQRAVVRELFDSGSIVDTASLLEGDGSTHVSRMFPGGPPTPVQML